MFVILPEDPPPIEDWEAFQAWVRRQAQPKPVEDMFAEPRITPTVPPPPVEPALPPLSQEEITSGRAFKVPEKEDESILDPVTRVLGEMKKRAAEEFRPDEPLGPPEEEVQRIQGLGPLTPSVQDVARGFGRAADFATRSLMGGIAGASGGFEQGLIEAGTSPTTAGQLTRDLNLEVLRRQGGITHGAPRAKPIEAAKHIFTKEIEPVVRKPEITKWVEENPRAEFVEEPPIKLIPEAQLNSIGTLERRKVINRQGTVHTKVNETFKVGDEELLVQYSVSKARSGGDRAEIDFTVYTPPKEGESLLSRRRESGAPAPTVKQGRDTLFTVASSVEKFIEKTKPESVAFLAADDRLIPTYEAFAHSLARKYDGQVVTLPTDTGVATVEFPRNRGNLFDPNVLGSGFGDFSAIMGGAYVAAGSAPYLIRAGVNAAKKAWPKMGIRTGTILDPTETLGPKVLMNFDRPKDLMKTITSSPVSGMLSLLKGLGYNKKAMFDAFESNTLASEGQKIANAVESGSLVSIAGDYKVPDGLSSARVVNAVRSLPADRQIEASQYVHYHDMLRRMRQSGANRVAGMSLKDIQYNIAAIEASFPQAKDFLVMHDKVMKENARFVGDGTEAIVTPKQAADMQKGTYALHEFEPVDPNAPLQQRISDRAHAFGSNNDITPALVDKPIGLTNAPRVDAFEMLNRATEIMLRSKVANARRVKLIKAMISTGKDAIVQVGKNQKEYDALIKEHPKWKDRITMVRENGVPKYYISSKFIKDMLHLDPHIAKHFWLYSTSRAFQFGTTGYGNLPFALTQFYREAILGPMSVPKGYRGIGIPGVPFSAIPQAVVGVGEQAFRRWQKDFSNELYRSLDSGSGGILRQVLDEKTMKSWADSLAKSYGDSLYNLYVSRGGAGISMSKNPIASGQKAAWREITRNSQMPMPIRHLAHTYMNMFDAMQNSSRYIFWKANYKKGKKTGKVTQEFLDDINIQSRHLTGELMISGRAYKGKGQLIESDYPKNWRNAAIPYYARSLDALKESTVWVNAFIKGQERLGRAYWENPFKFTTYLYTGVFLPMTLSYMAAAALGDEYLDYLENGRSELEKGATIYFPSLTGKPEDGWAIPLAPELSPFAYMYWNLLTSSFGKEFGEQFGNVPTFQDQAKSIMKNWFGIVMPPVVSSTAAAFGVKVPGSIPGFGEEAYEIKENPYSWFNPSVENYLKAAFGTAADAYVRPLNTLLAEGDAEAAWKEFWYQQKQRTPTVKKGQLHGFTELSEAYWDRLDKLNKLDDIYEKHVAKPGSMITKDEGGEGDVVGYGPEFNLIPETRIKLTKKGEPYKSGQKEIVDERTPSVMLPSLPPQRLGRPEILAPTNPEYIAFAKEIHDHFNARGSGAYGKMVSHLNNATKQIQDLRRENTATLKDVKARMETIPDSFPVKAELQQIDYSKRDSIRQAINVFEKERRRVYKLMNYYVKEVEEKLGTKLDTLDPYAPPQTLHLGIGAD